MDGLTATRKIRNQENLNQETPILALTANADSSTIQSCQEVGMNDFVVKPVRRNILISTVDKWVFLKDESPTYQPIEIDEVIQEYSEQANPFNLEVALEEFGDIDIIKKITKEFISNVESQCLSIQENIKIENYDVVRREAHSIKGGAATLEAVPLSNSAKIIEEICKEENFDYIDNAFQNFLCEFELFKLFVQQYLFNNNENTNS